MNQTVKQANNPEPTRLVGTSWDDQGNDVAQSVLTGKSMKVRALCLTSPDAVLPIVFVPGIMGTRLKVKGRDKGAAWFPPEGKWDAVILLLRSLVRTAADRQRLLNPDKTEVDDEGPAYPDDACKSLLAIAPGKTDAERARWRGWGQLHGDSYEKILAFLEKSMATIFDPISQGQTLTPLWQELVMNRQDAAKLGAQKPFVPLQEQQLRDAAELLYPVHAVGYNWLQSNKVSAERLAAEIDRITAYYRSKGKACEQVILITHSMGGLVARACAQLPGMDQRILGVLHGVMPALGAPATYKRIRAGFEGAAQVILGRNGADCTAVMANAAGPLELLPTDQYRTWTNSGERHWLRVSYVGMGQRGVQEEMESFLGEGDPYANIYLNNTADWWKLVREDLIDPAGREDRERSQLAGEETIAIDSGKSEFDDYAQNMEKACRFHYLIEKKYHPVTYAYYGADQQQQAWNEIVWKGDMFVAGSPSNALLHDDDLNGSVVLSFKDLSKSRFTIQPASGPGDGTVPAESGGSPTPFVVQIFKHEGKLKAHESYDHQYSYNAKLTQDVSLYSIIRIASESTLLKADLDQS
ncbi:alpha/beta hydrolase [Herbaspirillum sp. C7C2]|uniref:esterase/lipase family protein n=1 Tax=Herbaspirillum sp. C7C2 TaxID=2736666 RepID=UPI001F52A7D6|nr:GPI inositol-deacylase [Herbaspirillum sp. C7C2]MCI1015970.1 alpha/beta hydrolase [Herbaspirillum sp. C7C2]